VRRTDVVFASVWAWNEEVAHLSAVDEKSVSRTCVYWRSKALPGVSPGHCHRTGRNQVRVVVNDVVGCG
jgi:hypothetical protein